jgi:PEP-CTERM motif
MYQANRIKRYTPEGHTRPKERAERTCTARQPFPGELSRSSPAETESRRVSSEGGQAWRIGNPLPPPDLVDRVFRPPDDRCVTIWPPLQDLLQVGSRKRERRLFALVKQYALGPVAQDISSKARGIGVKLNPAPITPNAIRRGERPARRDRPPGSTFMRTQAVPEPSSYVLASLGLLGALVCVWFGHRRGSVSRPAFL